jgi:hypothetical protein
MLRISRRAVTAGLSAAVGDVVMERMKGLS